MNWLHAKGNFNPNNIGESQPMQLLEQTYKTLANSISLVDGEITPTMKHKLSNDIFIFSGFKTAHQLKEASLLLTDDKGQIKPFGKFLSDVQVINKRYNKHYLRAEYDFAVSSVTMASKWESFSDGDRYNLQYRTTGDSAVRPSHMKLHNITLPKGHVFWTTNYPPIDWG